MSSLQVILLLFVERMPSQRVHDRAGIFELNAVINYPGRKNGYKLSISARYAMREWVRLVRKFHSSFFQAPLSYSLCCGNELWATGEWSETGQGKTGEPVTIKGYWSDIYVRESDDWKIRVEVWNTTPDSVLLINKSFAPQAGARPSPAASPSAQ